MSFGIKCTTINTSGCTQKLKQFYVQIFSQINSSPRSDWFTRVLLKVLWKKCQKSKFYYKTCHKINWNSFSNHLHSMWKIKIGLFPLFFLWHETNQLFLRASVSWLVEEISSQILVFVCIVASCWQTNDLIRATCLCAIIFNTGFLYIACNAT